MRKKVSINSSSNAIEAYCDSELDDADKQIEIDHDSANVMDLWRHIDEQTFVVSSDSEYEENTLNADDLASWAIEFSIKHNALDRLLKLLQQSGHSSLPATARSLLKTCPSVELTFVSGMQYFYFGIKKQLKQQFVKYPSNVQMNVTTLPILLNIDGLPLFSSSGSSVWPVLCELQLAPKKVFPVVLTYGGSKPKDLTFLEEVIDDLNELLSHGLAVEDKHYSVVLKGIICDAPAKAMVKCIKQFSGYYGCDRCNQKGVWLHKVTYQEVTTLHLRTDHEFRTQAQEEHHHAISPICRLPVDMIKIFPIDYMHRSCLGCMRRLLHIWMRGQKKKQNVSSAGSSNK